jgi:hypothetical protein
MAWDAFCLHRLVLHHGTNMPLTHEAFSIWETVAE